METNCPVISACTSINGPYHGYGKEHTHPQWLLELETDGTIRHSSSHPYDTQQQSRSLIGSNLFDLAPVLGDTSDLKRDFVAFVKGERNRVTSCLRSQNGSELGEAIIIMTRSYETSWPGRREIVMMEIRS